MRQVFARLGILRPVFAIDFFASTASELRAPTELATANGIHKQS
jgi:hypothetical protein